MTAKKFVPFLEISDEISAIRSSFERENFLGTTTSKMRFVWLGPSTTLKS